jgi:hypothetical protein
MPVQIPPLIGAKPCQQLPPTGPTSRCDEERVDRPIDLLPDRVQTTTHWWRPLHVGCGSSLA